jgi:SAM-dependent methyltransferase
MEQAATGTANGDEIRYWAQVEGPHYVAEADRYDILMHGFSEALLDAAGLRSGERVLDIGCGTGSITIEAARRVGPDGAAVGVDVSPPMLDLARRRSTASRIDQVDFRRADAQTHSFEDARFDAVISRNGLMFFDDPDAAFANLARALRPGGRLAFVAPQDMAHSEWVMAAGAAAAPHVGAPQGLAPNTPGPYGLSDPDRTRSILAGAGFVDVTIEAVTRPMRIGDDVEDALRFILSMPRVEAVFAAAPSDKQAAAVGAARVALAPYAGPDGVVTHNNGEWLVTARL